MHVPRNEALRPPTYAQATTLADAWLLQYYDDAAGILRSIILSAVAPHRLATAPPVMHMPSPEHAHAKSFDDSHAPTGGADEEHERCAHLQGMH